MASLTAAAKLVWLRAGATIESMHEGERGRRDAGPYDGHRPWARAGRDASQITRPPCMCVGVYIKYMKFLKTKKLQRT
jgi:hypothetical protein